MYDVDGVTYTLLWLSIALLEKNVMQLCMLQPSAAKTIWSSMYR